MWGIAMTSCRLVTNGQLGFRLHTIIASWIGKKHHWLSPLYILEEIWWKRIYVLVLWGKLGMKWEMVPHYVTQASWDVSRKSWANSFYHGKVSGFCFITFPFCFIVPVEENRFIYSPFVSFSFSSTNSLI